MRSAALGGNPAVRASPKRLAISASLPEDLQTGDDTVLSFSPEFVPIVSIAGWTKSPLTHSLSPTKGERVPFRAGEGLATR
jgi:hypothetical protein